MYQRRVDTAPLDGSRAPASSHELEVRTLVEQIYEAIRGRILRSELLSGAKLDMSDLSRAFGVSSTPVRDAINLLAADGLVVVTPRRGTVVATYTAKDVEELYQLRLILEPPAAEMAAKHLTEEELGTLAELLAQLAASSEVYADTAAYIEDLSLDAAFHAGLLRGARNRLLDIVYHNLHAHIIVARSVFPTTYRNTDRREGEHERILDALVARDGPRARWAMELHLRMAAEDITCHLRETGHLEWQRRTTEEPASTVVPLEAADSNRGNNPLQMS